MLPVYRTWEKDTKNCRFTGLLEPGRFLPVYAKLYNTFNILVKMKMQAGYSMKNIFGKTKMKTGYTGLGCGKVHTI
jgi:hypothetical protein